jgi:class 3 adenylate cyclase
MKQQIRFCKSFDGTRIAYAVTGDGPPLVKSPHWLTHLEYEFRSPLWQPWIEALSREHALLRMDERGCGLSDWQVDDFSFDAYVRDLEAVVDASSFERFALFGHSQGGAIAVEYAARNPGRVTHLVLLGTYARGWFKRGLPPKRIEELHAQLKLIEAGWGRDDPSYRQMFSSQFIPGANLELLQSFSELQRVSTSADNAARIIRSFFDIDITESAPRVRCPTLILHARGDLRAPLEEARLLGSLIPDARLVTLETSNHALLANEPAFRHFFEELRAFVPRDERADRARELSELPDASAGKGDLKQRLAAIFAADVEGYSRLMAADERSTVAALDAARAVFRSQIESHQGRVVDMAGDSVLAVFDSAAGAVTAALAVQKALQDRQMRFRIGVHLGDVIEKPDGTIYGDGVNIAARLQALAAAGGITVSDAVRGSVRQRVPATFEDQGEQQVKNIADPIRTFRVQAA